MPKHKNSFLKKFIALLLALAVGTVAIALAFAAAPAAPKIPDEIEQLEISAELDKIFPERARTLKPLPYRLSADSTGALDIWARSAVALDADTGCILYEKNADEPIPPASMTKLFVMAVTEFEIASGRISLDDKVSLPPESWEENLPPDSSLMHLKRGQTPTLAELLTGLSVCSGNDAAIAVAVYTAGSVEEFVGRMNSLADYLGLTHTRFVEPSGYSERNMTTAREFAAFSLWYVRNFGESLARFHSKREFTWSEITQENTNKLLGILEGCDGLKTGFIYESGYNLALTAARGGRRILTVTMGGPGENAREGNNGRIHDGSSLVEWAFANFAAYKDESSSFRQAVKVYGSKERSVYAVPAYDGTCSVPKNAKVTQRISLDGEFMFDELSNAEGMVPAGTKVGAIIYESASGIIQEVPLVTERGVTANNKFLGIADKILWRLKKRG